jgi:GNAT superfamily N-acetyltransferase
MCSDRPDPLRIVAFEPRWRSLFAQLWVPWLEARTGKPPEPEDLLAVSDPETFYLRAGGQVFYAFDGDTPVGVVAVKRLSESCDEFCKLVVLESARGRGVGRRLVQACIDFSRARGAQRLMLQSFRKLEVALRMYDAMGFVDMPPPEGMLVLARTEIVMGMDLAAG